MVMWTDTYVQNEDDADFSPDNLPYGVFSVGASSPRVGVALGGVVLDLRAIHREGLLRGVIADPSVLGAASLNPLLALGSATWHALRTRLLELVASERDGTRIRSAGAIIARSEAQMHLPVQPRHFQDCYSSLEHATTVGRIFRPDGNALPAAFRHIPIAYHGRAGTVVISGTDVVRPWGMVETSPGEPPMASLCNELDFELELGFITGGGPPLGERITIDEAESTIFGFVLLNDWSARDIQRYEYVPLGPYLGKSFATSISAWVVTLEALAPFRVAGPVQDPPPPAHLRTDDPWNLDLTLTAELRPAEGGDVSEITRVNPRTMYWNPAQNLVHSTSNGARIEAGDLYGTGTVSGFAPGTQGCLLEMTDAGRRPLTLQGGASRSFLHDGDTVTLRGWASGDGRPRVGFGGLTGTIVPGHVPVP